MVGTVVRAEEAVVCVIVVSSVRTTTSFFIIVIVIIATAAITFVVMRVVMQVAAAQAPLLLLPSLQKPQLPRLLRPFLTLPLPPARHLPLDLRQRLKDPVHRVQALADMRRFRRVPPRVPLAHLSVPQLLLSDASSGHASGRGRGGAGVGGTAAEAVGNSGWSAPACVYCASAAGAINVCVPPPTSTSRWHAEPASGAAILQGATSGAGAAAGAAGAAVAGAAVAGAVRAAHLAHRPCRF
jgi:hypothetical protein